MFQKKSIKNRLIKIGTVILIIILSGPIFTYASAFAPFILLALCFGAYYLFGTLNVEYEYIFTNGELDIDCIYSKSRRKRQFSGVVRDFEIMAHVEDKNHIRDFNSATETKDYSSGVVKDNTYAFLSSYKGKKLKVIIEPDEVMVQAFSTAITPRKFFKKQ